MAGASIETTLELWASSLRDVKSRIRKLFMRISEERDSRFTNSRTAVSLIPGQHGVVDFRLPG
ncbi:hypothetical protein F4V91_28130 [Neorhizobium galegae]|uniref:Uncharacterized protein n=1 Tax=Neorhizobium galegae TaxID=399 RepID=A0A6A1TJJ0_NEOGA|nr:hypothetical protein [Neorhizobium galegae]KAB1083418.1 hypothetical protein F4V91_28130 [Neorhizobium galegae]